MPKLYDSTSTPPQQQELPNTQPTHTLVNTSVSSVINVQHRPIEMGSTTLASAMTNANLETSNLNLHLKNVANIDDIAPSVTEQKPLAASKIDDANIELSHSAIIEKALQFSQRIKSNIIKEAKNDNPRMSDTKTFLALLIGVPGIQANYKGTQCPQIMSLPSTTTGLVHYLRSYEGLGNFISRAESASGIAMYKYTKPLALKACSHDIKLNEFTKTVASAHRYIGAIPNSLTLFHHMFKRSHTQSNTANSSLANMRANMNSDGIIAGAAHEAILRYKVLTGTQLVNSLHNQLSCIDIRLDNDYPALTIAPKAMLNNALTKAENMEALSLLCMYSFMALANQPSENDTHHAHMIISERNSFGFLTPTVSETETTFRVNLPFTSPHYLEYLAHAAKTLDQALQQLFFNARILSNQDLDNLKNKILANLQLDGDSYSRTSLSYYTSSNCSATDRCQRVVNSIKQASTLGQLLFVEFETPKRGEHAKSALTSMLRGQSAQQALYTRIGAGEPLVSILYDLLQNLQLEAGVKKASQKEGSLRYQPSETNIRPQMAIQNLHSRTMTLSAPVLTALENHYQKSLLQVENAFFQGVMHLQKTVNFNDEAAYHIVSLLNVIGDPHTSGYTLQQAWEVMSDLIVAGVADANVDYSQDTNNLLNASDSESEFEAEDSASATKAKQRIVSRKHIFHNSMQAIVQTLESLAEELLGKLNYQEFVVAATRLEYVGAKRRGKFDNVYYEMNPALFFGQQHVNNKNIESIEKGRAKRMPEHAPKISSGATSNAISYTEFIDVNHLDSRNMMVKKESNWVESILKNSHKKIWVLDVTSAPQTKLAELVEQFSQNDKVQIMCFASSGMKHEQLGYNNHYGTIRLFVKEGEGIEPKALLDRIVNGYIQRVPFLHNASHRLRHAYKCLGFVPSAAGIQRALDERKAERRDLNNNILSEKPLPAEPNSVIEESRDMNNNILPKRPRQEEFDAVDTPIAKHFANETIGQGSPVRQTGETIQ